MNSETWEWNGQQWTLRSGDAPAPRYAHAITYDSGRARTVLFGGTGSNNMPMQDTWEWDGNAWTQVASDGPPARSSATLVFDTAREKAILYGGSGFGDAWSWDGSTWSLIYESGPPARYAHAAAYDTTRWQTVVFGGFAGGYADDTWRLPSPLRIVHHAESLLAVQGDPAEFRVVAVGTTPHSYQWRRNELPLVDNDRIHGATTDTLTFEDVDFSDEGAIDVLMSNECGDALSDDAILSLRCLQDLNANGLVDLSDLAIFLAHFGECSGDESFFSDADLDRRGCVDLPDLALLISVFGSECP